MMKASGRNLLWSLALAASCAWATATPADAQVGINVRLGPPPPPRHEFYGPPPRRGCFRSRGHWVARHNRWFWVSGRWICH